MNATEIIFLIIGIVLLALSFLFIYYTKTSNRPKKKWNLDTSVEGKIDYIMQIPSHSGGESTYIYKPTVIYTAYGRLHTASEQVTPFNSGYWARAASGDKVTVWYDSKNPTRVYFVPSETTKKRNGFTYFMYTYGIPGILAIAGIMFIGSGIFGEENFFKIFSTSFTVTNLY